MKKQLFNAIVTLAIAAALVASAAAQVASSQTVVAGSGQASAPPTRSAGATSPPDGTRPATPARRTTITKVVYRCPPRTATPARRPASAPAARPTVTSSARTTATPCAGCQQIDVDDLVRRVNGNTDTRVAELQAGIDEVNDNVVATDRDVVEGTRLVRRDIATADANNEVRATAILDRIDAQGEASADRDDRLLAEVKGARKEARILGIANLGLGVLNAALNVRNGQKLNRINNTVNQINNRGWGTIVLNGGNSTGNPPNGGGVWRAPTGAPNGNPASIVPGTSGAWTTVNLGGTANTDGSIGPPSRNNVGVQVGSQAFTTARANRGTPFRVGSGTTPQN